MKTDDLIGFLAQDLTPARRGAALRGLMLGLVAGALLSILAMMMLLGPRPDLHAAMKLDAFWMKFFYTAVLAVLGFVIVERQARAGADSRLPLVALAVPVVVLIVLAALEMSAPQADTAALVMGSSWTVCSWRIVYLALPLLLGLLLALRTLAPTRLSLAGAAAGLAAGATSATIYGFHCTEMAAPFILIWYTLGIAICADFGALLGPRLLRW